MTTRQISYRLKADGKAETKRDAAEVGAAFEDAGEKGAAAFERTNRLLKATGELSEKQIASYRRMAKVADEAALAAQAQARINGTLGVGGSGRDWRPSDFLREDEVRPGGLTRNQRAGRLNLMRQGADVLTTGAMGMDPAMIAIQQGPQIIDALAQAGIRATPAMLALGGTVAAVGAAVIAAGVAQAKYEASVKAVEVATRGLGVTSGMTAEAVLRQADAAAQAGDISRTSAREYAAEYVSTGKIGTGVLQDLVAMTKDYAATTRQDAAGATKELAAAFSDPAKGAKDLNDKLHFLRGAELEHIENLAWAGREAEAQAILVDRLKGTMQDASDATSGWARAFDGLAKSAGDGFDKVGKYIDRLINGTQGAERVVEARQWIAQADLMLKLDPKNKIAKDNKARWQAVLDEEYKKAVAEYDGMRTAALSQRDADRRELTDRYNPDAGRLRRARADRDRLISLGTPDEASKAALRDLKADIGAMEKGYKSAADMASKLGQQNRQNARDARRAAAEDRKEQREREAAIRLDGLRADHAFDNARRLAEARGDQSALDVLTRQGRLQDEINRYLREGFNLTQATVNARAQIGLEMQAESDRLAHERSNPEGFVRSEDRLALAMKGASTEPYSWTRDYGERVRATTSEAFHDGLMAGMSGGNFFDVFADRLKYAAAMGLADSLTNDLFGVKNKDGQRTGGLIASALKFIPKFAGGTYSAPGGLSLVGEFGPEIMEVPERSKIHTASASRALLQDLGRRAVSGAGGEVMNFHYSPVYHLQGTAEEIRALRAEYENDRRNFRANAVQAIADAKARRMLAG